MPYALKGALPYFLAGTAFGWTPDQVDVIDRELLVKLLLLASKFNTVGLK